MEHVNLHSCKKHDVENADLSEYLETRVAFKQIQSVRADHDTGDYHPHNRRYLQRTENQRAQQYHQKHYQKNCHRLL